MGRKLLKKSKSLRFFLFIILVFLFIIYGFIYFDNKIKPAVFNIAEMRVKEIATIAVNEAIFTEFAEKIQYDDLVQIKIDDEGNIVALQANTVLINTISSDMTLLIQNNIHNITSSQIKIPVGSILGSQILSQYGPMITLNVIPIGMTKVNFKTEFENAGINQTRHKIFLDVETYAKVIVPFNTNTINVHMTVPIAETIIVGEVPQSYVFIPENELTNILPSM
ncbi:MAG: sporulation protein YunB [Clostridiales bacterium]|nr:sporulation protein YunB [Clostridiales bacterium]